MKLLNISFYNSKYNMKSGTIFVADNIMHVNMSNDPVREQIF
jgi:hypothetical protein